jgi:hypothetical protein
MMGNAQMRPIFHHIPHSYQVLGEEDETDATEEEAEEAFTHTPVVQEGSGDVVMSSENELGS